MTPENVAAFGLGVLIIVTSVALGIPAAKIARYTRAIAQTLQQGVETTERHRQEADAQARDAAAKAEQVRLDLEAKAERATARTQHEEEMVARAGEVEARNLALLSLVGDTINATLDPSPALTPEAQEGWRMARDTIQSQLKRGLQETQTRKERT